MAENALIILLCVIYRWIRVPKMPARRLWSCTFPTTYPTKSEGKCKSSSAVAPLFSSPSWLAVSPCTYPAMTPTNLPPPPPHARYHATSHVSPMLHLIVPTQFPLARINRGCGECYYNVASSGRFDELRSAIMMHCVRLGGGAVACAMACAIVWAGQAKKGALPYLWPGAPVF